jgi:hypothetical protein
LKASVKPRIGSRGAISTAAKSEADMGFLQWKKGNNEFKHYLDAA